MREIVLNLVISGIPSIRWEVWVLQRLVLRFKPCYKWNTFNTKVGYSNGLKTADKF